MFRVIMTMLVKAAHVREAISMYQTLCFSHLVIRNIADMETEAQKG